MPGGQESGGLLHDSERAAAAAALCVARLAAAPALSRGAARPPDVELEVVAVELVLGEVQDVVGLLLELRHDAEEVVDELVHALDLVLRERVELVHGREPGLVLAKGGLAH